MWTSHENVANKSDLLKRTKKIDFSHKTMNYLQRKNYFFLEFSEEIFFNFFP